MSQAIPSVASLVTDSCFQTEELPHPLHQPRPRRLPLPARLRPRPAGREAAVFTLFIFFTLFSCPASEELCSQALLLALLPGAAAGPVPRGAAAGVRHPAARAEARHQRQAAQPDPARQQVEAEDEREEEEEEG